MRFEDLEPVFLKLLSTPFGPVQTPVLRDEAQGVMFLCPQCYADANGPEGVHQVICWGSSVINNSHLNGPGRWDMAGHGAGDMTLIGASGSNSVEVHGGCHAHFFVERGDVRLV